VLPGHALTFLNVGERNRAWTIYASPMPLLHAGTTTNATPNSALEDIASLVHVLTTFHVRNMSFRLCMLSRRNMSESNVRPC
jgi:hypothetical protein